MTNIESINETLFESLRHANEHGQEYWSARELQPILEYKQWRQFNDVINKAIEACKGSNNKASHHFAEVRKMVASGISSKSVKDFKLSRYACYLIAMNGDPRKKAIALAQTYFAIKTRQQELIDHYDELGEDAKRLAIRQEMKKHNKSLADAAHNAGVIQPIDYAIFTNEGYKGLYGGLSRKDIHSRKQLKGTQDILDYMGHEELAANLFRATQTEAKLRREKIHGKLKANKTHFEVGQKVRQTIRELGGTMPENLPTPDKSIKQIEREQQKKLKKRQVFYMLRPKVIYVEPLENYHLLLRFSTGEQRIFDVRPYISGDWYGQLNDPKTFATAHVSGHTVEWNGGQDIAPHELYDLSTPVAS